MYQRVKSFIKKLLPKSFLRRFVNYFHWMEVFFANVRLGFPARGLKIIGVTGTSGKSTVAAMLSHILNQTGQKAAHFTTTNAFWGGQEHDNPSGLTTETAMNLYGRIKQVKAADDDYLVIESSAHAIVQHRLAFLKYRGAVFTNLSHDHLDYFGDMATYAKAKRGLFKLVAKNDGWGVFSAEDDYSDMMRQPIDQTKQLTFGITTGEVHATGLVEKDGVSSFTVNYKSEQASVKLTLTGTHNVQNAVAAMACALQEGVSLQEAATAMSTFQGVKGRMEQLTAPNGAKVLIDFAHTPDAFETVLSELRNITKGKIIAVFGGYGDRDPTIRPPFGQIAATYADHIVLTEDTVGSETVTAINQDIKKGIEKASSYKGPVDEIEAREDAILHALKLVSKDDTVALLGKGHEREIKRYPTSKPWDEIQATKDAISRLEQA